MNKPKKSAVLPQNSTEAITLGASQKQKKLTRKNPQHYDMLVFSHLRWDFVYQRPQHLIERMSQHYRVLFIEEPVHAPAVFEEPGELKKVNDRLNVLRPYASSIEDIANVITAFVSNKEVALGWFYSAAFVPLIQQFNFEKIVYDCMDELTMFKGASPELGRQEQYLLSEAKVVFTGGKLLFESKLNQHSNVYCFPSSVDRLHFEKALNGIQIPESVLPLKKPVIGYYGVIDERIDLELIAEVAKRLPDASIVMVGPLAKIHEHDLPRAANIHYAGIQPYSMLPAFLKGFDIAMMPFAINDATRYISPTKTLEYMAAQKPIISTPIHDVVRDYQASINIIENADEFCNAVASIQQASDWDKEKRNSQYDFILKETSWNKTAEAMYEIIKKA